MRSEPTWYFAYGSNMNPARVSARGLQVVALGGARLAGFELCFDKRATAVPGGAHANIGLRHDSVVEGVLYELESVAEIVKMDRFERAPINYSRDLVPVEAAGEIVWAWTYFANRALRAGNLKPPASYVRHLLAGARFLSADYVRWLQTLDCLDDAAS